MVELKISIILLIIWCVMAIIFSLIVLFIDDKKEKNIIKKINELKKQMKI